MKFHDTLNEQIWDLNTEDLIPEVKEKLKEIAEAFIEFLEIPTDAVLDKVITGSSASYNYNKYSDLDLHIIVDYDKIHEDCPLVNGYLNSLKKQFNDNHDITIHGVPVELYAEQKDQGTVHNGLYSLQTGWIDFPEKIAPTDNDAAVEAKFNEIKELVNKCDNSEEATELLEKIYNMRKAGLAEAGEFCTENLAFKKLRNEGCMDKLRQIKKEQIDKQLSLESYKESLEQDVKELTKTDDYYKVDGSRVSIKNGSGSQVELMDLQNLGKKLEKKGYKVYCSNYYIDAKKNESVNEESQLDKETELAQKLIDTCEQMGFEVVQDRFDWIDLGNGIHIQVWTGSVTVVDYNTGDEKELPLETEEDLQNIIRIANELSNKNESIKELSLRTYTEGLDEISVNDCLQEFLKYCNTQGYKTFENKGKDFIDIKGYILQIDCFTTLWDENIGPEIGFNFRYKKQAHDSYSYPLEMIKLADWMDLGKRKALFKTNLNTLISKIEKKINRKNKNESIKEGFNKGDKVQLKRKNNKIGIVKSIFNGDKDKNNKDIKYLDVEFEDGTKEGRPASDFKKVNESIKEDYKWHGPVAKVTFDNGDVIETEINGTDEEIKSYYMGKTFNLGKEEDDMHKVVKVEVIRESIKESEEELKVGDSVFLKFTPKFMRRPGKITKFISDDVVEVEFDEYKNNMARTDRYYIQDVEKYPENIEEELHQEIEYEINVSSSIYIITDRKLVNEMLEVAKTCKSIYDFEKTEIAKHCELMTKIKRNNFTGVDLEELVDNIRYTYENARIDTNLDEWEIEDNKIRTGSILVTSENDYYESLEKFYNNIKTALGEEMEENIKNINEDTEFDYMLLSRLRFDCDYFLGYGNGFEKNLWAGSVERQIAKMRELYNRLPEKPEWISLEDIDKYEKDMLALKEQPMEEDLATLEVKIDQAQSNVQDIVDMIQDVKEHFDFDKAYNTIKLAEAEE